MIALLTLPFGALMFALTAMIISGNALGVTLCLGAMVCVFLGFSALEENLVLEEEQELCQEYVAVNIPSLSLEWIDPYSLEHMISQYEETQAMLQEYIEQPIIKELKTCKVCNILLPPNMNHFCFAEPKINIAKIDTIPIPINSKKVLLN